MKYDFIYKAQQEPDLKDFLKHLEKPLHTLDELLRRYKSLDIGKKTNPFNMALYLRIDKILNKVLPDMVDNFCNFSFEYRNKYIIKEEIRKSYTAKDMLLKNLASLIDEVKELESSFNEENRFEILAQRNYLNNFVPQPSIELANEFDYNSSPSYLKSAYKKEDVKTKSDYAQELATSRCFSFIDFGLVLGLVTALVICACIIDNTFEINARVNTELNNLDSLRDGIKSIYGGSENFLGINNAIINAARITPDSMIMPHIDLIVNTFGEFIKVSPVSIAQGANNLFRITYPNVPSNICEKLVSSASSHFNQITVAGKVIKAYGIDAPIDVNATGALCDSAKNVDILFDSK